MQIVSILHAGYPELGDAYVTDCGPAVGSRKSRVPGVQVYIYYIS